MAWLVEPYKGQKYNSIKKSLIKKGELFIDPEFPPNNKSLFYSRVDKDIEWKRPKELCKVPKLVLGISTDDLNEGLLGNTWFVSACCSLTSDKRLWDKVVPNCKEQEWDSEGINLYAGIFHFHFWRYGRWVDVVVDDKLPTKDGNLITCHSKTRNEFWSALLEKAYAKLYGDYESLKTGFTIDALIDFTGGVAERLDLSCIDLSDDKTKERLFNDIKSASDNSAFIVCTINISEGGDIDLETAQGLLKGFSYSVTSVLGVNVQKGLREALGSDYIQLIRLKNPRTDKTWSGPWSEESTEYNSLSRIDREKLKITFETEGESWMSFADFLSNFTNVDICHFVNTAIFSLKKSWSEVMMHGEWTVGVTGSGRDRAGGCDVSAKTFLRNPQYVFDITDQQDTVMMSLEQDDTSSHKMSGQKLNQIGFHVMRVEKNRRYRVHIAGIKEVASDYNRLRNVFLRFNLTRGRYVVIPSTYEPEQTGKFLLRIYTSKNAAAKLLDDECPKAGPLCCGKPYVLVTKLKVIKAEGLKSSKSDTNVSPLVLVKCERESCRSDWTRDTPNPEWYHFEVIFYRKNPDLPITLEILSHKVMLDEFLGITRLEEVGSEEPKIIELKLYGKSKKEQDIERPGILTVEITSSDDLTAL